MKMELECQAVIKKVDLNAKLKKAQMIRIMRIRLEREFDPFMARAIGGDAMEVLAAMKTRSLEKAVMPIDSVVARLDLTISAGGPRTEKNDVVTIPSCVGRKATATAAVDEDEQPTIVLEFEFAFDEKAWAWFGRNCGGFAEVTIGEAQQKLKLARAGA